MSVSARPVRRAFSCPAGGGAVTEFARRRRAGEVKREIVEADTARARAAVRRDWSAYRALSDTIDDLLDELHALVPERADA